ncbi:hypothetical protein EON65_09040 [archaeon]|nr:MAG: hypothetical protein EON65_09040 [archaeon]
MKYLIFFVFSFFLTPKLNAQGCRSGGQIYTNSFNFFGTLLWSGAVSESCPASASSSTQYAKFISNTTGGAGTSCTIGFFSSTGILVNYRIDNCPLDDYIWLLIFINVLNANNHL